MWILTLVFNTYGTRVPRYVHHMRSSQKGAMNGEFLGKVQMNGEFLGKIRMKGKIFNTCLNPI